MPKNIIRILFWVLLVATLVVFWISLRTPTDALAYTIAAVVLWVLTYGAHRWLKNVTSREEH